MKKLLHKQRQKDTDNQEVGKPFSFEELQAAIQLTKDRKAAGFDVIYP